MSSWSPLETSTNGFTLDDSTHRDHVSLREKKQQQWSKEKADNQEWFPFGKPGAGAPLKATRSTRNGSLNARSSASINSVQLNGVNHDLEQKSAAGSLYSVPMMANGHHHQQQQSSPVVHQIPYSPSTNVNGNIPYGYVPSVSNQPSFIPYYQAYPGAIAVPLQHAGNGFVTSSSANGAVAQLPTQSYQPAAAYYQVPAGYPHPLIVQQTSGNGLQPSGCNYATAVVLSSERHNGSTVPQVSSQQENNVRGSVTASALTEPSVGNGAKLNSNSHDISNNELSYTEQWASQLPVWQMEQHQTVVVANNGEQQQQQQFRPTTLPIAQQLINGPNDGIVSVVTTAPLTPSLNAQILVNTSPDSHRRFIPVGASTPLQLPPPLAPSNVQTSAAPTAWVTPLSHHHQQLHQLPPEANNGHLFHHQHQRTAVVSPLQSKAPSISGNETLDIMNSSFSGVLLNKSSSFDDSGIHKRRYAATDPKDVQELEEKQQRIQETKMAIEEQIAEKRRQHVLDAEKDRLEMERLERERRLLELRESRENEHELNKWKELMEEEQRREAAVREALEKAKLEAKIHRKAKLHQHAWSGRRSDSEELDSPPYGHYQPAPVNGAALTIVSVNSGSSGSIVSSQQQYQQQMQQQQEQQQQQQQQQQQPVFNNKNTPPSSLVGSSLETSRSHSLPPLQHYVQSPATASGVSDDRPIKPLTVDPLKLWEQIAGKEPAVDDNGEPRTRLPRREAYVRQSLRKSRSTEASRLLATKRSESLERKKVGLPSTSSTTTAATTVDPIVATPKSSNPVNGHQQNKSSKSIDNQRKASFNQPPAPPESRLASAATYIVRRDIFAPSLPLNNVNGVLSLPVSEDKPPVPARRDKERKKSKSKESTTPKEIEQTDSQDRHKLLHRRSSADPTVMAKGANDSNGEPDNPWGDQLGGLNPLLQPISTRSRRKGRQSSVGGGGSVPDSPVSPTQAMLHNQNNKVPSNNVSPKNIADSMSDLAVSSSSDSGAKKETSQTPSDGQIVKSPEKPSLRSPSMDRFNFRSPLYSSFSVKIKQPNERQSDVLRQLSKLKEQLKKSQKDVEDKIRLKSPFLQNGKKD